MALAKLKRSRKAKLAGDVFVYRLEEESIYRYGLVVKTGVKVWTDGMLVYLYKMTVDSPELPSCLRTSDLLIPPMITDASMWGAGFFLTIGNLASENYEILTQHCFRRSWMEADRYYDEYKNELAGRSEPCGIYGLTTATGMEKNVRQSAGIPLP